MNKFYIILIVFLGLFLAPSSVYACGSGSGDDCCKKEVSSEKKTKDCCSKKTKSEESKDKACSGKCNQSMCSTSSVSIGMAAVASYEIPNAIFSFLDKKQNFSHSVSVPSAGYASLWLLPKIG